MGLLNNICCQISQVAHNSWESPVVNPLMGISFGTTLRGNLQWHTISWESPVAHHLMGISSGTLPRENLLWHTTPWESPVAHHLMRITSGTSHRGNLQWHTTSWKSPRENLKNSTKKCYLKPKNLLITTQLYIKCWILK